MSTVSATDCCTQVREESSDLTVILVAVYGWRNQYIDDDDNDHSDDNHRFLQSTYLSQTRAQTHTHTSWLVLYLMMKVREL